MLYSTRFISCVGLHAVWSAIAGMLTWTFRDSVREGMPEGQSWICTAVTLTAPILLHGFFETFLKKGYLQYALLTGLISFAVLLTLLFYFGSTKSSSAHRFRNR